MRVHLGMMTMNEATDLFRNVELLLPHVDSIHIIDGGSTDLTIPTMRNWARVEPKINYQIRPWRDNFPAQRNNYISEIAKVAQDGDWILTCDPDEFFSSEALQSLRRLAEIVPRKRERYGAVSFQCRSVSMRANVIAHESLDNFWKPLYVKWSPHLKYTHIGEGAVHETLKGLTGPVYCVGHHPEFQASLTYSHVKQENCIWPRGCRNFFIGGGGPNLGHKNKSWVSFRAITDRIGLKTWKDFYAYLIAGEIDGQLRDWMIEHRKESSYDGASEVREVYKTMFRLLHPELEPAELQDEVIE